MGDPQQVIFDREIFVSQPPVTVNILTMLWCRPWTIISDARSAHAAGVVTRGHPFIVEV